jgi:hypothetical protein
MYSEARLATSAECVRNEVTNGAIAANITPTRRPKRPIETNEDTPSVFLDCKLLEPTYAAAREVMANPTDVSGRTQKLRKPVARASDAKGISPTCPIIAESVAL